MSIFAAIRRYIAPCEQPITDHREANIQQARTLLDAERDYWTAYYERAWVRRDLNECEYARDKLDELDRLEAASHA